MAEWKRKNKKDDEGIGGWGQKGDKRVTRCDARTIHL